MRDRAPESNIEWNKWGNEDPLWGVASWMGKEKKGSNPWTDEEFYRLGELDWQDFFEYWRKFGIDIRSCLEIGCGAGRITMHLANCFQNTYAVDVSEGMIAYAKNHIKDPSIKFFLIDGTKLPIEDNSVSGVFSTHVFQHFDSLLYASNYFSEISRVLIPGGSMMIHLPIFEWHPDTPEIFVKLIQLRKKAENIKAWVYRRLIQRELSDPIMRILTYPISYFYKTLPVYGFSDIEIVIFPVKSNNKIHPFVLAHKSTFTDKNSKISRI